MKWFIIAVHGFFESTFLQLVYTSQFLEENKYKQSFGFFLNICCLNCIHWSWKNCHVAWQRQFHDKDDNCSIIMETGE